MRQKNSDFVMVALDLLCKQVQLVFPVLLDKSFPSTGELSARVSVHMLKILHGTSCPYKHMSINFCEE